MRLPLRSQLLLVSFLTLLVYYPTIFAGFNPVDDQKLINSFINASGFSFSGLFLPGGGYYYRPLLFVSFFADSLLWDMSTSFMHLENILLHLCNSILVLVICRNLFRFYNKEAGYYPLLAALLFSLHPINTEAVNWISGRTDVMACFFVLVACWLQIKSAQKNSLLYMFCAVAAFFLGCLAKETAIFYFAGAVAIVFALQYQHRSASFLRNVLACVPAWLLWCGGAAGYLIFRSFALSRGDSGITHVVKTVTGNEALGANPVDHLDQLRIAFKVMGFYFKKMFVPWPLNFAIIDVSDAYVLLGCALVVVIVWLIFKLARSGDIVAALYLGSIGMASAALLVVLGNMAWTPVAERYLYMPSAAFCVGLSLFVGLGPFAQKVSRGVFAAACCVLLVFGSTTMHRAVVWSDPVSFLEDTVEKSPKFVPAQNDLAALYYVTGEKKKAMELYSRAAEQVGEREYAGVDVNRAHFLAEEGLFDEAREILRKRLENPGKNYRRGAEELILVNLKYIDSAKEEDLIHELKLENVSLLETLTENNSEPFLHYQLGKAYLALDNKQKAFASFDYAHRHAPVDSHYKEPARILAEKTRDDKP